MGEPAYIMLRSTSVVITTTGFTKIARAVAKAEGMADVRIAEYPGAVGVHAEDLVRKNVEDVLFGRIVDLLTQEKPFSVVLFFAVGALTAYLSSVLIATLKNVIRTDTSISIFPDR